MSEIYEIPDFPFSKVHLGTPFNKNGSYFIKMTVADSPLYIQPPKCSLRQGVITSGKKMFCDLVFDIEDNAFLAWMENIEEIAKTKIYENRAKWFETELDRHDIENSLTSPYKMYKSGKMFIIRANIPTTLGKSALKIYDENEREVLPENLKEDTNLITILEFRGIKCSVRSFQFEIDVRQMLVLAPVKIFEKCVIKKSTPAVSGYDEDAVAMPEAMLSKEPADTEPKEQTKQILEETFSAADLAVPTPESVPKLSMPAFETTTLDELYEVVDFDLEKIDGSVQLKNRNEVYYKMYKDAKQKAREAKLVALTNYLEAKRIKNTYLLEDSSDDDDSEVDLEESANDVATAGIY